MAEVRRVATESLSLSVHCWPGNEWLPWLLLHGIGGRGSDWSRVAARLAPARATCAPDARGHGASDWSKDEAYHTDAYFADVALLLDALDIGRCLLAGYSMGGGVAIMAAAALPERIAGLVVVDAYPSPTMTPGSARIASRIARMADTTPAQPLARLPFDPAIARRMAQDLAAGRSRMDLWPFWENLTCPALLVRGERSEVLPAALADEMLSRQPLAHLDVVPGTGHQVLFAQPEQLADELEAFARWVQR